MTDRPTPDPLPVPDRSSTSSCCDSFSRSQAIRRVLGGGGAPVARDWDPRMPIPAGVKIDRRRLLVGAAGSLLSVYGAGRLGLTDRVLGDGIAQAATTESSSSPILVSVFLQGGVDSLALLGPAGDPTYRSCARRSPCRRRAGCRSVRTRASTGILQRARSRNCTTRA